MSIHSAGISDLIPLSLTIKKAFLGNEVFSYIFGSSENYEKSANLYFEFVLKTAFNQGEVFYDTLPEKGAILLAENSNKLYALTQEMKAGGYKIPYQCGVKTVFRSLNFKNNLMALRKDFLPPKHLYVYLLTVNPELQKKGTGIRLLEFAQSRARELKLPLVLETMTQALVQFYTKRGFCTVAARKFEAADLTLYGMRWDG